MLMDAHEGKISIPVDTSATGNTVLVTGDADSWIYIHEFIGSCDNAEIIKLLEDSTELITFDLSANQGLTLDDIPGDEGVPRFKIKPGKDFILNKSSTGTFLGGVVYSRRY